VLAKGDGSAAWVWTIMGVHDLFMALFPEKAQHEYWANDRTLSASSFAPFGRVTEVQGGLKLNGKDLGLGAGEITLPAHSREVSFRA